jgi:protein TonB
MGAAIAYRKPKSGRLVVLFLCSIGLHVAVAMFAIWASHHLKYTPQEEPPAELGMDVTLGEEVQELIAAQTPPAPPEPTPPEPPPEPPQEETPPEPPPIVDEPDFVEPKPEPKPPAPKVAAKPAPAPPGAKTGPKPQPGVVGGNVQQGKTEGTPGGQKIGHGWKTPRGPYPPGAMQRHVQGTVNVRVSTGSNGKITSATPIGGDPELQSAARRMALTIWEGPPNASNTITVKYVIP